MSRGRVAVSTGGGDAPGLNAALRAVTVAAVRRGWEVIGIRRGYAGLLEPGDAGLLPLDRETTRGIAHLGGTILGTNNRGDPFRWAVERDGVRAAEDASGRLVSRFRELGLQALVTLGGDGSMQIAARLLERGLPRAIGLPKTIDGDLRGTERTFGFDTAVATAVDALDRLHSTAEAHDRVMVVEVMGRYAGWIALAAGLAGGADAVLLPERPFELERVAAKVREREAAGRRFSIVVVAEGAREREGALAVRAGADAFAEHPRLGGIGERVAAGLAERTAKETRALCLGHLLRGGSPVASDRLLALELGAEAARVLDETDSSGVVVVRDGRPRLVPFAECTGGFRPVPEDHPWMLAARGMGISLG
ncbi:MAG: ATP-dependent 6-phosphofructokinase [Polyangiaceae bacterium]|nr:ATP-dependent 6-phosphofructokinase [Polyangiaceae bacterium]